MKKNILIFIIALLLTIGIVGGVYWHTQSAAKMPKMTKNKMILFYGDGCPHCARVEAFMAKHRIDSKTKIARLDVRRGRKAIQLMIQKAKACHIKFNDSLGIPFLWTGSKCVEGDQPIINYFSKHFGIKA